MWILPSQKARDAFEDGRWSRLHPRDRKEALIRLAKLVKRNARELAVLESPRLRQDDLRLRNRSMSPKPSTA